MPPWIRKTSNLHKVMYGCEISISESMMKCELNLWRSRHIVNLRLDSERSHSRWGPAQDVPFFYTPSHLSELQSCASIISTKFPFILIFK